MRDSIVFYKSFYEAVEKIEDPDIKLEVLVAIMEYAFFDRSIEFKNPVADAMWTLIKPQIDANNKRYEDGKKGGAPKGNQNARKQPKQPLVDFSKQPKQPNVNVNVNVNENVNDNVNVNGNAPLEGTDTFLTFGQLGNVLLTKEQKEKLEQTYQSSKKLIDKVSRWLPNAKTEITDHYAMCLTFAENDNWPKKPKEPEPKAEEHEADFISEEERQRNIAEMKQKLYGVF